jgi:hypothetical protein
MGFCCPYAFFRATRTGPGGYSNPQIANKLGISDETVKYWRRKVRRQLTRCEKNEICIIFRAGEVPRINLFSLRERGVDPFI